ncbi:manganese catalase family protein [Pseudonocardia sp. EV170527-09]|uniref:manganese catalase family protein n=1 Tax=Pseudonocardia sp. EV170527-09 TaxID=2603411 RepID=UPI001F00083E|nr:manganese catalase family protein [Pseudonocardia sp. EV170527-09]
MPQHPASIAEAPERPGRRRLSGGAQGALPVDAQGDPWTGKYVYDSGNLLYNLMLGSTGRLQKCRLYESTANRTARSTIAYLIVRDQTHENAYAKALEALGVTGPRCCRSRRRTPRSTPRWRRCWSRVYQGPQSKRYTFSLAQLSEAGKPCRGPAGDAPSSCRTADSATKPYRVNN